MATSDPDKIPLTPMQQALSKAAAIPQEKRKPSQDNKRSDRPSDAVKGNTQGVWQRQAVAPDIKAPPRGNDGRQERYPLNNPRENFRPSEEQIKEIDNLAGILITVFSNCVDVMLFIKMAEFGKDSKEITKKITKISEMMALIDEDLIVKNGFTLEKILSIKRAIKMLTLDIRRVLVFTEDEISLTNESEANQLYKESLKAVLDFAKEDEITGNRELSPSLTQKTSRLVESSGIRVVMRPKEKLPLVDKKENITSPAPAESVATTPTKTPEEIAAEKLAVEKERNRKIYERANSGEEITLDKLKSAGFSAEEAQDFLDILELTK